MQKISVGLVIFSLLACGSSTGTGPTPANISGTWNSASLHLNLTQTGSALSGSGTFSFTDPSGASCNSQISGNYAAGSVSVGLASGTTCAGSFNGTASGDRIVGVVDFWWAGDGSQARRTTIADVTLVKQ